MRVSLAGLGAAATRGHLPALRELESDGLVKVVAACDPDMRQRAAVLLALPDLPTFASAEEMLDSVDSDLMVIASPPAAHASLAVRAADYRQHILCEKPGGCTVAQVSELEAIWRRGQDRAFVASYQYRFSPPWKSISRILRAAAKSGQRVSVSVDVQRTSTDQRAVSSWRDNPAMGGGFADHAVHFLALGRELGRPFAVESASREYDSKGREQVSARLWAGSNLLDLSVSYRAAVRSTALTLSWGKTTLQWKNGQLRSGRKNQCPKLFSVPSLSDRSCIDALYRPMYRDLLESLRSSRWRHERADELIEVSRCLTTLLTEAKQHLPIEKHLPVEPAVLVA
ncbi:MAG TPA: Gfo/Idh/MocA family oxidoreductase [Solirubrobacterales bacterium]|nr:Gfo/Idh/MocA family oxidoreductase [Solirubrobacterales bacterium]